MPVNIVLTSLSCKVQLMAGLIPSVLHLSCLVSFLCIAIILAC